MLPIILRTQAYAKINWCLSVTGRNEKGYHLLDMLMQRVSLCDTLYASPAKSLSLSIIGDPVEGPMDNNLVLRAARALQPFAGNAGVRLTLVKRIPQGAGLGGGSSDAAAALKLLIRLWGLRTPPETVREIALGLGADVPFFLSGVPSRIRGIGEQLTPVSLPGGMPLVIVKATPGLNTGKVYLRSDALPRHSADVSDVLAALMHGDLPAAQRAAGNDLYEAARLMEPGLEAVRQALAASGADYVLMSGSGSAVYGVYASDAKALLGAERLRTAFPEAFIAAAHTLS